MSEHKRNHLITTIQWSKRKWNVSKTGPNYTLKTTQLIWFLGILKECFSNVLPSFPFQFSGSVVSDSLRPHEPQHTRPTCPLPTPRVYSNLCPLSQWCPPTISSPVVPFSSCLQSSPASGSFSSESVLAIRWPKYWSFSFSISPSNEYSGLISFRMDWFSL